MFAFSEQAPTSVMVVPPRYLLSTGNPLSLSCSIMLANPLTSGTSLEVTWIQPDNSTILTSSADLVSTPPSNTSFSTTLNITSLTPSHAGLYQCSVRIVSIVPQISSSQFTPDSNTVSIQREFIYYKILFSFLVKFTLQPCFCIFFWKFLYFLRIFTIVNEHINCFHITYI